MAVRAVRGATQLERDERVHLHERVSELVRTLMEINALSGDDLISIVFTATGDIHADYPAYAARRIGLVDVPLLCTRELEIEDGMPRVVRVLAHVETELTREDITHVYLHGAANLRRDLTHVRAIPDDSDDSDDESADG
ncbi:MAG: chorismate mutase [Propionibacteriales bacterium]|nr:chorismate mutase [Propionibacteriales bacterium]